MERNRTVSAGLIRLSLLICDSKLTKLVNDFNWIYFGRGFDSRRLHHLKERKMKFLASKNVSLGCALLNGVLALNFIATGSWLLALMSAGFCALCTRNYLVAGD